MEVCCGKTRLSARQCSKSLQFVPVFHLVFARERLVVHFLCQPRGDYYTRLGVPREFNPFVNYFPASIFQHSAYAALKSKKSYITFGRSAADVRENENRCRRRETQEEGQREIVENMQMIVT